MRAQVPDAPGSFVPVIENDTGLSPVLLVCEHASNALPSPWGDLGLTPDQTRAHIAWDPGALGLARGLAQRLDATLIHAPVSRLIYDCNRAPDMPGAMPARSEVHDIPGNAARVGAHLQARLRTFVDKFKVVGDVRGVGLMAGIEMVSDKAKRTPMTRSSDVPARVAKAAYRRGLMVRISGPNLILSPPLIITREEVDFMVDVLEASFTEVEST